ncbi:MAG: hypothetical protein QOJ53_1207, partial [Sphingomonadales bacterium]|nr:hypothetical protein [Sphingomonadales bacterium]
MTDTMTETRAETASGTISKFFWYELM